MPIEKVEITASTPTPALEDTSTQDRRGRLILSEKQLGKRTAEFDKFLESVQITRSGSTDSGGMFYEGYCIYLDNLETGEELPEYTVSIRRRKVVLTLES